MFQKGPLIDVQRSEQASKPFTGELAAPDPYGLGRIMTRFIDENYKR